eukprot:IDg1937t1
MSIALSGTGDCLVIYAIRRLLRSITYVMPFRQIVLRMRSGGGCSCPATIWPPRSFSTTVQSLAAVSSTTDSRFAVKRGRVRESWYAQLCIALGAKYCRGCSRAGCRGAIGQCN